MIENAFVLSLRNLPIYQLHLRNYNNNYYINYYIISIIILIINNNYSDWKINDVSIPVTLVGSRLD